LVAREFRRRLRIAFEQAGITIGVPQQVWHGLPADPSLVDPSLGDPLDGDVPPS
jgi:hypothetical protein